MRQPKSATDQVTSTLGVQKARAFRVQKAFDFSRVRPRVTVSLERKSPIPDALSSQRSGRNKKIDMLVSSLDSALP